MILKNKFLILNLTFLVAFSVWQIQRKVIALPPVYVYVHVPTPGMKMSDYEAGCLAALTRVGKINAGNRAKIAELENK